MNILKFGNLPFYNMIMAPENEEGGSGGDGGNPPAPAGDEGGDPAGDEGGDPAGDQGGQPASKDTADGGQPAPKGDNPAPTGDEGGEGDDPPANANPFPDDWREQLARGADGKVDDKQLKILKRFNSPKDYNNAYFALNQKISSGEFKKPLSKDAKPEEVAAWRKENGIPENPDGYLEKLPEGLVFGENDNAVLKPFLEDMHNQNASPELVQSALSSYQAAQAAQAEYIQERDSEIAAQTEDELRAEWQGDYRPNINAVNAFIDSQFPADIKEALMNARLGDESGTPLMHSPNILRAFASLGRIMNPQSTVTHGKGMDSLDAMETRIGEIESQMGNKKSAYWTDGGKIQSEYRELVGARDRIKG